MSFKFWQRNTIYINLEHSRLSQLRVVKKVKSLVALSFTFWKMKEPRKFSPWNLHRSGTSLFSRPSFPMLKSWGSLARRKKKQKTKNSPWPKKKNEYFFYWLYITSLSMKNSSKMPTFWNYRAICPCFETQFSQNEDSM